MKVKEGRKTIKDLNNSAAKAKQREQRFNEDFQKISAIMEKREKKKGGGKGSSKWKGSGGDGTSEKALKRQKILQGFKSR